MAPKKGHLKPPELIKKQKRDAERRRRARIKADPVKYEEALQKERERRKRRKEAKKIVSVADLPPRDQRAKRKDWREKQQKCRANKQRKAENFLKLLRENTPPTDVEMSDDDRAGPSRRIDSPTTSQRDSPTTPQRDDTPSSVGNSGSSTNRQRLLGMKQARLHREMTKRMIEKQKGMIEAMKSRIHNLHVKYNRLAKAIPPRARILNKQKSCSILMKRNAIREFLEQDINSKICPGKRDTITKRKIKKQKRIFSESLQRLHVKYNNQAAPGTKVSYATFCRLRPFWIVPAKLSERDTCLCATCENAKLLVEKLHSMNMIEVNNIEDLCSSVVCDDKSYSCMSQKCRVCSGKMPRFLEFDDEQITYMQWIVKTETRFIRGKEKDIKRTVKEPMHCFKKDLAGKLTELLPKILKHRFHIHKQYTSIKTMKDNLKPGHVMLHIDFSENYCCKYFSEIQAVHFGASRQQISLHTGLIYFKPDIPDPGADVEHIAFCTISECLRHDASAVYAHLKKALWNLAKDQNIRVLHIVSDGPSSQYKNKNNFYLFTQHLLNDFNISKATWNFSESGHGKGPADGVGAAIKQTADSYVRHGNDISDFTTFYEVLKVKSNVLLYKVTENEIKEGETLLRNCKVKTIAGTKLMHQLTWTSEEPNIINLRESTCSECKIGDICQHFPCIKKAIAEPTTANVLVEKAVSVSNDNVIFNDQNMTYMTKIVGSGKSLNYALNIFLFDYRTTTHKSTGATPARLMMGRELRNRLSLLRPSPVYQNLIESQEKQLKNGSGSRTLSLNEGEEALIKDFRRGKKWSRGRVLKEIVPGLTYLVQVDGMQWKRHANQIYKL